MRLYPVYPFRAVLRELRLDAGLTFLAAAEATSYRNYERWEDGTTRVGPQHVRYIAEAFGVTDDLCLLVYAWLLDRYSPHPGHTSVDLGHVNLAKVLRQLPSTTVDLGEFKDFVAVSGTHTDVAVACLGARYRHLQRVVLPPVRRSPLPARQLGTSLLETAFCDLFVDMARLVGRLLLASAGCGRSPIEGADRAVRDNLAPMLSSPAAMEQLIAEVGGPHAKDALRYAEMLRDGRQYVAAIVEGATGEQATPEAIDLTLVDIATGRLDKVRDVLLAAARNDALPDFDPAAIAEMAEMHDRVTSRWEQLVRDELADRLNNLDSTDAADALDVVVHASSGE